MAQTALFATQTAHEYHNKQKNKVYTPYKRLIERSTLLADTALKSGTTALAGQMVYALEEAALLDAIARREGKDAFDLLLENDGFDLQKATG